MSKFILATMLLSGVAILSACEQKSSGGRQNAPNKGGIDTGVVNNTSYTKDIQPLLKKKCTSCHAGNQAPDLSGYEGAKKSANAIYRTVKAGSMPTAKQDRLTSSQEALIKSWIDGGLKKTIGNSGDSTAALVSYDSWVKDYLKKHCISCHGSKSDDGDFSTYSQAAKAAGRIYESMDEGSMPKGGKAEASAKSKMKSWLNSGAPEQADLADVDEDTVDDQDTDNDIVKDDDSAKITYDLNVKKIIGSYCITCHASGATKPELDTRSKVVDQADAVLESIAKGSMPKTGPLSDKYKGIIQKWVDGGKL